MSSRLTCLLLVLALASGLGPLAPGRATAAPTPEQRAAWIRQIKLSIARRQAGEGLQEMRERAREGTREAEQERERLAVEAGTQAGREVETPDAVTGGLRLEAPAWFSLTRGPSGPPPADALGPFEAGTAHERPGAPDRTAGARQLRSPTGPDERRGVPSSEASRSASRLSAERTLGFAPNIRVSDPTLDDPTRADAQSETAIAAYQNYVLATWNDSRNTGHSPIGYAYSTNGGQSFVVGGYPSEGDNDVVWTSDPVLTVNEKTGEFYFCALVDPVTDGSVPTPHGVAVVRGTFSGSTFTWDTPRIANSVPEPDFIDKPWAAADSLTGNLYVCYTRYSGIVDSIWVQRTTNRGLSWSTPFPLSSATSQLVQGSRVAVGPDGEVYAVWKEIGLADTGEDFFRIRKSTNAGATWGPEVTATTLFDNFGTGAPGFNRELGISFPSIVVDRSNGPRRGRVYLAWNETVNFWDSIPDTTGRVNESEPNDTTFTANFFVQGQMLAGSYKDANDFDYWRFNAIQGHTYVFWSSSTALYTLRIFCSDGVSRLAFSGDRFGPVPGDGFIVWTAPTSAAYYVRLAIVDGSSGSYVVRTSEDIPGGAGQRARDTRDIFVRSSPDGVDWSGSVTRVNTDALGYDDWLPEIAVANGDVYTAWYDFSAAATSTCGAESNVNMARSDDGGATWVQLGPITDQLTAWTSVNSDIIPNQGDYIALFANPAVVYPSWADGRCTGAGCVSTPDVFAAPFLVNGLQIAVSHVVVDTGHVAITWVISGANIASATLYRRVGSGAFAPVTTLTPTAGALFYDDQDILPSTQYQYRLGVIVNNTEVFLAEQTVQVPGIPAPALSFTGAFPNPTPGPLTLTFTLPTTETAWLTIFDAAGRKLREEDVSSNGAGTHAGFDFSRGLRLKPGLYLIRLRQGHSEVTRRVVVIP